MGTGIAAVIPIKIGRVEKQYFIERFFDNYIFDEKSRTFSIKTEILLKNYKSFLEEFYDCIEEEFDLENIPDVDTFDEFETLFDREARDTREPFLERNSYAFSFLSGKSEQYWLFYMGSYKAYLETYRTLSHFERTLAKALKNPLASAVKLGIWG